MKVLDTFCCIGGAGKGYQLAGHDVTGVDLADMEAYYPGKFVWGHAIDYIERYGYQYDFIHASPPCQYHTAGNRGKTTTHVDLIDETREALIATGRPWVIENVMDAPLRNPLILCGSMFDLTAIDHDGIKLLLTRHRKFESPLNFTAPAECNHTLGWIAGAYGGARRDKYEARFVRKGGYVPPFEIVEELMGIDWAPTEALLFEAIPPAYTEHLGNQLVELVAAWEG